MTFSFAPLFRGVRLSAVSAGAALVIVSASALAQGSASGSAIDEDVLNLFLESRIQKPANQATSEERAGVSKELADIYQVTELPRAQELAKAPRFKAQLELQHRAMLFNAFASDFLATNPATDEEILKNYQEQVAANPPQEFKARHILVESQSAAIDVITELEGGADFAELAKTKSIGPSNTSGGDLGWFPAQAMVKPFSDAVANLADGATTETPVQTQFGWHVILREDSRAGTPPPLESVREVIKNQIEQGKFQSYIDGLRK